MPEGTVGAASRRAGRGARADRGARAGRGWRVLTGVLALVGVVAVGFAWIVSSPTGASPDDDFHLTSIWCPYPIAAHCTVVGESAPGYPLVEVPQKVAAGALTYAYQPEVSAAAQDTLSDTLLVLNDRVNTGAYPGLFYTVMHWFAGPDVDRSVLVMRGVNFGIAIVLYGAALLLLAGSQRRLFSYTLVATALPVSVYFTASTNPTAWAITGVVAVWIGLHGYLTIPGWRRAGFAALAVAGTVLAAGGRTDAALYCAIVAVAVTVLHLPTVVRRARLGILPAVVAVAGLVVLLTASDTGGYIERADVGDRSGWQVFWSNMAHLPDTLITFWSCDLGWFDVPTPTITSVLLLVVTLVVIGAGLVRARADWHKVAALVILGGAIYGLPVAMMQFRLEYFAEWGIQVRYLVPLIVVLAGVALTGSLRDDPPPLPRWATLATLAALATAHGFLLHTLIRRYVTGTDVTGFNLDAGAEWWAVTAVSPMGTWALGTTGAVLLCTAVALQTTPRPLP